MNVKRFDVRVLLTVTTGRLITTSLRALYELLGWMTDDSPFTHQLPRFATECKPWLLRWFPQLCAVDSTDLRVLDAAAEDGGEMGVESWLRGVLARRDLELFYDVPRIPPHDHERKNPYDELVAMRGTDEGIVIVEG